MKGKLYLGILIGLFLVSGVLAVSDIAVFQGQYFEENEFQEGTYSFIFDIYDDETAGTSCFSNTQSLSTGFWGQWRAELNGISAGCADTTKDYFVEITIDSVVQTPRRRLTHFNYLRKNVADSTTGDLTISNILNFLLGGYIQEFVDYFLVSKGLEITGDLGVNGNANITGITYVDELQGNELRANEANITEFFSKEIKASDEIKVGGLKVCLEDGTDCQAVGGGSDTNCSVEGSCPLITYDSEVSASDTLANLSCSDNQIAKYNAGAGAWECSADATGSGGGGAGYVSFISTVDGSLGKNDMFLPLGTDSGLASSANEASWIIDRDMIITGILWNAASNSRTKTSAITLFKSTSNKASFTATSLSKDIQGVVSGSDTIFSISFSQGDLAVLKYESGGRGGNVVDLSITLIGTYD